MDRLAAAEPAVATVLDSTKRNLRLVVDRLVIDMHDSGLDPLRQRHGTVGVFSQDAGSQPVGGLVGEVDRLIGVTDHSDGGHRSKGPSLVSRQTGGTLLRKVGSL